LLRFQVLHRCVHQFQLLLCAAGQKLDVFQSLIRLKFCKLLLQLLLRLLRLGENQKYVHGCPPFRSVSCFNLCVFFGAYVDRYENSPSTNQLLNFSVNC
jgi:hypothetical protein